MKDEDSGSDDENTNHATGKKNSDITRNQKSPIIGTLENDVLKEFGSQIAKYNHPRFRLHAVYWVESKLDMIQQWWKSSSNSKKFSKSN
ncbi:unnamed protein product [Diamesa tonsa]